MNELYNALVMYLEHIKSNNRRGEYSAPSEVNEIVWLLESVLDDFSEVK